MEENKAMEEGGEREIRGEGRFNCNVFSLHYWVAVGRMGRGVDEKGGGSTERQAFKAELTSFQRVTPYVLSLSFPLSFFSETMPAPICHLSPCLVLSNFTGFQCGGSK